MEEVNLKEILNYFLSKSYILIIILIIVLLLGNTYSLFIKDPLYKSKTTLVLVSESNSITQSDVTLNNNLVSTYAEIIKSRNVLEQVIKNLDLDISINELESKISVAYTINTQLINVSVMDKDAKEAQIITQEIANVFIKQISKIYNIENVAIVDDASYSEDPYNKNIIKENIVYALIGIALGLSLIFLIYTLDTSINSVEDIENKLDLVVLGTVPKVGDKNE